METKPMSPNRAYCYDTTTKKEFIKEFDGAYEEKKFINKCKRSKKIIVMSYTYADEDEREYIEGH